MPEYQVTEVRPPTPEEERLLAWFAEQELRSPDHLEAAARQVVGLVTGMVGLLLGVVAVAQNPLPTYLAWPPLRWLAAAGIVFLLLALVAGLIVLWPRRVEVSPHNLTEQRTTLETILRRKARALSLAMGLFGLGVATLGAVLVLAVLTA